MSEILCRKCGKPLGEHDRGRYYAHVCEECCALYKLCPDCGTPIEITQEQLKQGFACTGYHTAGYVGEERKIEVFRHFSERWNPKVIGR